MRIDTIRLHQYRNYEDETIAFPAGTILLYGANGQGKTNLLESLYLAGIGKSYRGLSDGDLIRWGESEGSVIATFTRSGVSQQVKVILSTVARKEIWINETKVPQRELIGTLNEVLFSPDDLQLVKGSPSLRRRFMDMEISQVSPSYYKNLLAYNRILAQRNTVLKEMRKTGRRQSLEEWDRQLARYAAALVVKRLEALHKISFLSGIIHKRLTNGTEKLSTTYKQPYFDGSKDVPENQTDPAWYFEKLQQNLDEDMYRTSTSVGPHRDDLVFYVGQADLRKFGSQGQQRTAVLALKLSELEYMKSEAGEYPVLLLDDVMSELDMQRRQALLDFVKGRIQTFITTTEPGLFVQMEGCTPIEIVNGSLGGGLI